MSLPKKSKQDKKQKIDDGESLYNACSQLELPKLLNVVQRLQTTLVERLAEERSALLQDVEARSEQLKKERDEWETVVQKLNKAQLPEYVRLNVGGVVFASSRDILQRYENSFFSALLSGRWEANLKKDIFIDRSPALFGRVMDFLRGDHSVVSDLSDADLERLAIEADFYQLDELKKQCYYFEPIGDGLDLGDGKSTIITTGNSYDSDSSFSDSSDDGVTDGIAVVRPATNFPLRTTYVEHSFKIKVDVRRGDVILGLCTKNNLDSLRKSRFPTRSMPEEAISVDREIGMKTLQPDDTIRIRLHEDLKVEWTLLTKNSLEEILLLEKQLEKVVSPLYFFASIRSTCCQIKMC